MYSSWRSPLNGSCVVFDVDNEDYSAVHIVQAPVHPNGFIRICHSIYIVLKLNFIFLLFILSKHLSIRMVLFLFVIAYTLYPSCHSPQRQSCVVFDVDYVDFSAIHIVLVLFLFVIAFTLYPSCRSPLKDRVVWLC